MPTMRLILTSHVMYPLTFTAVSSWLFSMLTARLVLSRVCTAVMYSQTFLAVSSWPDSLLTVSLILTSLIYSSDVLTDLYGCVQLAGLHDNYEANPDLTCVQQ
jgi:hypothetical protein